MLNKGDEISCSLEWTLEDHLGTAVDFVSATIEHPTESLEMTVKLYDGCLAAEAVTERSRGIDLGHPYKVETKEFQDGRISWEVKKPKLGHLYQIAWDDPSRPPPI